MNADLEHLIVLQAQDLEGKRLRDELVEAPRRVRAAEGAHNTAEVRLQVLADKLRREEVGRRRQGTDADSHRDKLTRLRRQLAAATSAAQITALEHEISFGEAAVRQLEDEELESLGRSEDLEIEQAAAKAATERTAAHLGAEQARAAELTRRNQGLLAGLEAERRELRGRIAESLLAIYDRVSKARGTGIAEAVDSQCTACRMKVRPQRWADLTGRDHENETFTCETCGRILFHDPRRNSPGAWAAGDRLAAALKPVAAAVAPLLDEARA